MLERSSKADEQFQDTPRTGTRFGAAGRLWRYYRLSRYTAVSVLCFLLQNVILISSSAVGLHYETGVVASTAILIPVGFTLQAHLTFAADRTWGAFLRYAIAMLSNLPLSMTLAWVFCGLLHWPMVVASPSISVCLFCWNYLSSCWALDRAPFGSKRAS